MLHFGFKAFWYSRILEFHQKFGTRFWVTIQLSMYASHSAVFEGLHVKFIPFYSCFSGSIYLSVVHNGENEGLMVTVYSLCWYVTSGFWLKYGIYHRYPVFASPRFKRSISSLFHSYPLLMLHYGNLCTVCREWRRRFCFSIPSKRAFPDPFDNRLDLALITSFTRSLNRQSTNWVIFRNC